MMNGFNLLLCTLTMLHAVSMFFYADICHTTSVRQHLLLSVVNDEHVLITVLFTSA